MKFITFNLCDIGYLNTIVMLNVNVFVYVLLWHRHRISVVNSISSDW